MRRTLAVRQRGGLFSVKGCIKNNELRWRTGFQHNEQNVKLYKQLSCFQLFIHPEKKLLLLLILLDQTGNSCFHYLDLTEWVKGFAPCLITLIIIINILFTRF